MNVRQTKKKKRLEKIKLKMKEYITTDTSEIHRIITDCKQLHVNKLDNLEERGTFLGTHNLPRLNQEETENLTRSIMRKQINQ